MSDIDQKPKVGVGVMVFKDGKVLLGKRNDDAEKASSELHGEGTWTMPGGKLDFGETLKEAACREAIEETGIKLNKLELISVTDEILTDKHFVTVGFLCEDFDGDPRVMEPEEITEWRWFDLNDLPEKVFPPSAKIINNFLEKKIYRS
ncbi:MAG TPA: NUDIX domain-containing protein [Candidatus Colwellbacteria bacterium]|nr:NUDIX domain-containing protein [Candidatus Colwellbacteria bacterium]